MSLERAEQFWTHISTYKHQNSLHRETPPNGPKKPQNVCILVVVSLKPRLGHILGYVAQNTILRAPSPPATTHLWCFPTLRIAQTDT